MSKKVNVGEFVQSLVECSEKAAFIARAIRYDEKFSSLVQEKTAETGANKKFFHDFKTLADVLIQETIKYDLDQKYNGFSSRIFGEENGTLKIGGTGRTIDLSVKPGTDSEKLLQQNLSEVLLGDSTTAANLARLVYASPSPSSVLSPHQQQQQQLLSSCNKQISIDNVGLWVDPIDGTQEYVKGRMGVPFVTGDGREVYSSGGLQCCTILIGVFDMESHLPIIGVINIPFDQYDTQTAQWSGRSIWGVCYDDCKLNSLLTPSSLSSDVTTRKGEVHWLKSSFQNQLIFAPAAGYKILLVLEGKACAYLSAGGNLFLWDTCAPHAILRSLGGGVAKFSEFLSSDIQSPSPDSLSAHNIEVKYGPGNSSSYSTDEYNLHTGVICYRSLEELERIGNKLRWLYKRN